LDLSPFSLGGDSNNDGTIFSVTVPEPSTLALLGIGAVSLLAYAWRRPKLDAVLRQRLRDASRMATPERQATRVDRPAGIGFNSGLGCLGRFGRPSP
jgi:hypothetical protein